MGRWGTRKRRQYALFVRMLAYPRSLEYLRQECGLSLRTAYRWLRRVSREHDVVKRGSGVSTTYQIQEILK